MSMLWTRIFDADSTRKGRLRWKRWWWGHWEVVVVMMRSVLVLILGRRSGGGGDGGYMILTTCVEMNWQRSHQLWWQHK